MVAKVNPKKSKGRNDITDKEVKKYFYFSPDSKGCDVTMIVGHAENNDSGSLILCRLHTMCLTKTNYRPNTSSFLRTY